MPRSHKSAVERLQELPEVFTLNTAAAMLDCDTGNASTYIARWKDSGLVKSLGPRTGIHFNLLKNPQADQDKRMEAIGYLFPGAMIGGVSAVHAAGWTTQFPRQTEIIIPKRRSFPAVDDALITTRPLPWIREARNWIASSGPVPWLDPAFALADCIKNDVWHPDPDDLEWYEIDAQRLQLAFRYFDIPTPEDWAEEIEHLSRSGQDDLFM